MLATAADLRVAAESARIAYLFTKVGLSGADMGMCWLLPRIIGHGRASELLYTGRVMKGEEAERWGFFNGLSAPDTVLDDARELAVTLADGPTFAHAMTKRMMHEEWDMGIDDAIEAEARAQAVCMETRDFRRAFEAFADKRQPVFEGD